jgi:hypothetical protein
VSVSAAKAVNQKIPYTLGSCMIISMTFSQKVVKIGLKENTLLYKKHLWGFSPERILCTIFMRLFSNSGLAK